MAAMKSERVLEVLAALGESPSPVRYPEVYATADRLFRVGPDDAALCHVVRWLLRTELASVRAGGLHLSPQVVAIAQRACIALDDEDTSARLMFLQDLGIHDAATKDELDDVGARILLVPPVPTTWPKDPTRGWSPADAAVIAAASTTGRITSTRVRKLWFDIQSTELDRDELTQSVSALTTARLVTLRSKTLRLTLAGQRCRTAARRRQSRSDGGWSGDQPIWAALAALADNTAPVSGTSRQVQVQPGLASWLDDHTPSGGRHARH